MAQPNDFTNILKEAQKMQEKLQAAQEKLSSLTVTGEAGGGLVKIVMNCRHEAKSAFVNKTVIDEEDMLEDLIVAAINDAVAKVLKTSQEEIASLTNDIKLPADFNFDKEDEDK